MPLDAGQPPTRTDGQAAIAQSPAVQPPLTVRQEVPDPAAMRALGRRLAGLLRAGDLVVLSGALGAGKTTLAQGIGEGLDIRGPVTSPTFVIARVHPSRVGGPDLVHVDAYRLGSLAEVDDLDLDTGLDTAVTLVEWGQGLVEGLSGDRLQVVIERARGADTSQARSVLVHGVGPRWQGAAWPALNDEAPEEGTVSPAPNDQAPEEGTVSPAPTSPGHLTP